MLYPLFVVSNNLSHTPDNLQTDTLNVRCRACRLTGEGALRYGLSCSQKKSQKKCDEHHIGMGLTLSVHYVKVILTTTERKRLCRH